MGWVLRLTALWMATGLLVLGIGGTLVRPTTPPEPLPLIAQANSNLGLERLFVLGWGSAQATYELRVADLTGFDYGGLNSDGTWAYFTTSDESYRFWTLYRFGERLETVLRDIYIRPFELSPARRWLMYQDVKGPQDFWVANLETGQRWRLTDLVPSGVVSLTRGVFSADEQWLYVVVDDFLQPNSKVMRVRLADGTAQEVWTGPDGHGLMVEMELNGWLVVAVLGDQPYRVRPDGSAAGPLIRDATVNVTENDAVFNAFPEFGLAIVAHETAVWGVDVETGQVLWQHEGLWFNQHASGPTGWIDVTLDTGGGRRLHLPSGELRPYPAELGVKFTIVSAANDDWLAYITTNPVTGLDEWWQVFWDTGRARLIRPNMDSYGYRGMSPDENWLYAEDYGHGSGLYRVNIRDGRMERVLAGRSYSIMGWQRPPVRAWHPLAPIATGGVLLAAVMGSVAGRGFIRRPRLGRAAPTA